MSFTLHDGALPYLTIPAFDAVGGCCHAFSTRVGGVSQAHLSSLNFGLGCADAPENIQENLRRFGITVGFDPYRTVYTHQVHGDCVRIASEDHAGMGAYRPRFETGVDALITQVPNLPLLAYFADCVPVFLYDPCRRAVGICHSGWRGTVAQIAGKTVGVMEAAFGCKASDILAGIGPSIGSCHFEVGAEVATAFWEAFGAENEFVTPDDNDKYHIDLWAAIAHTLRKAGVTNCTISEECTYCNPNRWFSHRYSNGKRGNMAAVIALTEDTAL